jgi:hypothetical protein
MDTIYTRAIFDSMTTSNYHAYWAEAFAVAAATFKGLGRDSEARTCTKICIYHLSLMFFRLGMAQSNV